MTKRVWSNVYDQNSDKVYLIKCIPFRYLNKKQMVNMTKNECPARHKSVVSLKFSLTSYLHFRSPTESPWASSGPQSDPGCGAGGPEPLQTPLQVSFTLKHQTHSWPQLSSCTLIHSRSAVPLRGNNTNYIDRPLKVAGSWPTLQREVWKHHRLSTKPWKV